MNSHIATPAGRPVLLSSLLRFSILDEAGRRATVRDLGIDPADGDYPAVTHLHAQADGQALVLPWSAVRDLRGHRFHVARLADQTACPGDLQCVLLKRDVLDSLIIDVAAKQINRVNDLALVEGDGALRLRAADTTLRALLRRVLPGLPFSGSLSDFTDWHTVEFLRGDPVAARRSQDYHHRIEALQPAEIAWLLDGVPFLHAAELLTILPDPLAADTLEVMSQQRQVQVLNELDRDQAVRLLGRMAPDGAADLLGVLEPEHAQDFLTRLPADRREAILTLLRYDPTSAGGIMTNDVVLAAGDWTVAETRGSLKEQLASPDFVYYIYVIETLKSRRLMGLVTLRALLLADDTARLTEVMQPDVATVLPEVPADAAAWQLIEQHVAALPVVESTGQIVGVITVDAAMRQVAPAGWRTQAPRVFS